MIEWIIIPTTLAACVFFGLSMNIPRRVIFPAAMLGLAGQLVYKGVEAGFSNVNAAVFAGASTVCIFAEVFARLKKTPSTVIIYVSIVPLLPGVMLYRTMSEFTKGNFNIGLSEIVNTLVYSGSLALAVVVSTIISRNIIIPIYIKLTGRKK